MGAIELDPQANKHLLLLSFLALHEDDGSHSEYSSAVIPKFTSELSWLKLLFAGLVDASKAAATYACRSTLFSDSSKQSRTPTAPVSTPP